MPGNLSVEYNICQVSNMAENNEEEVKDSDTDTKNPSEIANTDENKTVISNNVGNDDNLKKEQEIKKQESLVILVIAITLLNVTHAAVDSQIKENTDKLEGVSDNIRKISDKDFRSEFIGQEWTYFLNKTSSGRIIISVNEGVKKLNPFWNLVLGVNYSFSWGFWIAFLIWLTLFFILLPPSEIFFKKKIYAVLSSFAIASLIGLAGVIKEATEVIGSIINNIWTAVLIFLLLILITFIAKRSNKFWKQLKEKEAKRKEEQSREILFIDAETVRKKSKKEKYNDD
jgi:heme/copper-type cytochrome/quinol oxidase subunit 2